MQGLARKFFGYAAVPFGTAPFEPAVGMTNLPQRQRNAQQAKQGTAAIDEPVNEAPHRTPISMVVTTKSTTRCCDVLADFPSSSIAPIFFG